MAASGIAAIVSYGGYWGAKRKAVGEGYLLAWSSSADLTRREHTLKLTSLGGQSTPA